MKDFYILDNLEAEIDEAVVMKLMDCQKDTPARKEMEAEYWQLCGKTGTLVKPVVRNWSAGFAARRLGKLWSLCL